jgi:hypothetical protein
MVCITLVLAASSLNTHHLGVRVNISWLGVWIMCKSGVTYLLSNVVSVTCSQENCSPYVKQQSITHYTEYVFMTFCNIHILYRNY